MPRTLLTVLMIGCSPPASVERDRPDVDEAQHDTAYEPSAPLRVGEHGRTILWAPPGSGEPPHVLTLDADNGLLIATPEA